MAQPGLSQPLSADLFLLHAVLPLALWQHDISIVLLTGTDTVIANEDKYTIQTINKNDNNRIGPKIGSHHCKNKTPHITFYILQGF